MHVVLTAAYGMGNVGDEAIAEMAIRHLRDVVPEARITVLVWDMNQWRRAHGCAEVRALPGLFQHVLTRPTMWLGMARAVAAIGGCDALVMGGGGLVRDRPGWLREYLRSVRLAAFFRKRIVVLSVGADRITNRHLRPALRVFQDVHALSVRDASSRENLVEAIDGVPHVDIVSDGVFDWPTVSREPPPVPVLGINLCDIQSAEGMGAEEPRWLDILSDVLKGLDEGRSLRIVSLPTAVKDVALSRRFCSLGAGREHIEAATPGDYTRQLSRCTAFIGMRLHACILASRVQGLPMRCIAYAPKTMDAFRDCGAGESVFTSEDLATDAFRASVLSALTGDSAHEPAFHCGAGKTHPRDWLRTHLGNA